MNIAINLDLSPSAYYDIVPERLYHPEMGDYHTYGVRITAHEYTDILHDVSPSKKTTERIVWMLNYHRVSPVHLHDVIIDMLP